MDDEIQPLDYRSVTPVERVRPRLWLSHMVTASVLCVVAVIVDRQLRFDALEAGRVVWIELILAAYGITCAVVSLARGALETGDRITIAICLPLLICTALLGGLMPRVVHN